MKQDDYIEAFIEKVPVACLLISTISQVSLILDDVQLGDIAERLHAHCKLKSSVTAGIVKHHHLFDVTPHVRGNALQYGNQGGQSVICDDQNADALAGT